MDWLGLPFCPCSFLLTGFEDNYGMLLGHFTRQNGVSTEEIRQFLSIGEDYEDLE